MMYGQAKLIYGCVSLSTLTVLREMSNVLKKHPQIIVDTVDSIDEGIPEAEVVIFNGLDALLTNRSDIHSDMVVILCAGPLVLDSFPELIPLDYQKSLSYEYDLLKPSWKLVAARVLRKPTTPPAVISRTKKSQLSMIVDSTITGSDFINGFNRLSSVCNHKARNDVRKHIALIITEKEQPSELLQFLRNLFTDQMAYTDLERSLKTKDTANLFNAVRLVLESGMAKAKSIANKQEVELFELRYLAKLCKEQLPEPK